MLLNRIDMPDSLKSDFAAIGFADLLPYSFRYSARTTGALHAYTGKDRPDRILVKPNKELDMPHTLPNLPYAFDALEPHIDAKTMEIHSQKHHKAYVDNLNKALESAPELANQDIVTLLRNINNVPAGIKQAVINNGGGHHNHALFWEIMGPNAGGEPTGQIADAIKAAFGDFASFKAKVKDNGLTQFGSGWSWVVFSPTSGKLEAIKKPNQDSPLMDGLVPVLGVDVWEHAYYLKYQNLRASYLDAWWNVVNWKAVEAKYVAAKSGK